MSSPFPFPTINTLVMWMCLDDRVSRCFAYWNLLLYAAYNIYRNDLKYVWFGSVCSFCSLWTATFLIRIFIFLYYIVFIMWNLGQLMEFKKKVKKIKIQLFPAEIKLQQQLKKWSTTANTAKSLLCIVEFILQKMFKTQHQLKPKRWQPEHPIETTMSAILNWVTGSQFPTVSEYFSPHTYRSDGKKV